MRSGFTKRLLPTLAGMAAFAMVAIVAVIAFGGDDGAEPVISPAAADRPEPPGGGDADKAESDRPKKEQDEEPKREEQQAVQESTTPQPEPEVALPTDDGDEPDSGAPEDRGAKDKAEEGEMSCAEIEKATRGEDPALKRFVEKWAGPCE